MAPPTIKTRTPWWKLTEANLYVFSGKTLAALTSFHKVDIGDVTSLLTNHILAAAMASVPVTLTHLRRRPKSW